MSGNSRYSDYCRSQPLTSPFPPVDSTTWHGPAAATARHRHSASGGGPDTRFGQYE
ncbi:hypothetical protein ACFPM0_03685 [Pseudonocardia sulfidoxydans]|uniref:hypothetical protein n=1 Tax=Pseudonocardia sulfidoxydans TaxID=54011 RepID=UPI003607D1F7